MLNVDNKIINYSFKWLYSDIRNILNSYLDMETIYNIHIYINEEIPSFTYFDKMMKENYGNKYDIFVNFKNDDRFLYSQLIVRDKFVSLKFNLIEPYEELHDNEILWLLIDHFNTNNNDIGAIIEICQIVDKLKLYSKINTYEFIKVYNIKNTITLFHQYIKKNTLNDELLLNFINVITHIFDIIELHGESINYYCWIFFDSLIHSIHYKNNIIISNINPLYIIHYIIKYLPNISLYIGYDTSNNRNNIHITNVTYKTFKKRYHYFIKIFFLIKSLLYFINNNNNLCNFDIKCIFELFKIKDNSLSINVILLSIINIICNEIKHKNKILIELIIDYLYANISYNFNDILYNTIYNNIINNLNNYEITNKEYQQKYIEIINNEHVIKY